MDWRGDRESWVCREDTGEEQSAAWEVGWELEVLVFIALRL